MRMVTTILEIFIFFMVVCSVCLYIPGGSLRGEKSDAEYFKKYPERLMHWKALRCFGP